MERIWEEDTVHGRFWRRLLEERARDIAGSAEWQRQLRYNAKEVAHLQGRFGPTLETLGLPSVWELVARRVALDGRDAAGEEPVRAEEECKGRDEVAGDVHRDRFPALGARRLRDLGRAEVVRPNVDEHEVVTVGDHRLYPLLGHLLPHVLVQLIGSWLPAAVVPEAADDLQDLPQFAMPGSSFAHEGVTGPHGPEAYGDF